MNGHFVVGDFVVDRVRETPGQPTVMSMPDGVGASIQDKRVDFGEQAVEEVIADPRTR